MGLPSDVDHDRPTPDRRGLNPKKESQQRVQYCTRKPQDAPPSRPTNQEVLGLTPPRLSSLSPVHGRLTDLFLRRGRTPPPTFARQVFFTLT
jgi:hypothetical protein